MIENLKNILTQKFYGIPVFILAIAGVAAMVWFLNRGVGSTDTTEPDGEETTDVEGDAVGYDVPTFSATESAAITEESATVASTNKSWFDSAYSWLTASKGYTGTETEAALTAYLNGDALSAQQSTMVNLVISQLGRPPAGPASPSSVSVDNSPAAKQGTPPTVHTVRGTRDNSLSALTRLYWGLSSVDARDQLRAANLSLVSDTGLEPGTKVTIPVRTNPKFVVVKGKINTLPIIAKRAGISQAKIQALNPGMATASTLRADTRVQIG